MPARNFSATIMLNNCGSRGGRDAVLGELGKLMTVDMFGGCSGSSGPAPIWADQFVKGYKILDETYPFHLSFENSLCKDYVTERFWTALRTNMIPVVLNWANMSRMAPKHSYIDVKDFGTIAGDNKFL